ncbi:hypothetical protein HD554DRAFT_2175006 [Boletus coccyginus]|nr:hypothetical protein HD554DRAFT_2175006 [Boletus coccyginus]
MAIEDALYRLSMILTPAPAVVLASSSALDAAVGSVVRGPACVDISIGVGDTERVVAILVQEVLSRRVTFYSTASLVKFRSVLVPGHPQSDGSGKSDRNAAVDTLRTIWFASEQGSLSEEYDLVCPNVERYRKHRLVTLASLHGLESNTDCERLGDSIVLHLTSSNCAHAPVDDAPACAAVIGRYFPAGCDGDSTELRIRVLDEAGMKLGSVSLQCALKVQGVTFEEGMSLFRLRSALQSHVARLHKARQEADRRTMDARRRACWPEVVSTECKVELVRRFVEVTSSHSLREFICASCNGKHEVAERSDVPFEEVDFDLLKRPDRRVVDGNVVDFRWLDSSCAPPVLAPSCEELRYILVANTGIIFRDGVPRAVTLCAACNRALASGVTP